MDEMHYQIFSEKRSGKEGADQEVDSRKDQDGLVSAPGRICEQRSQDGGEITGALKDHLLDGCKGRLLAHHPCEVDHQIGRQPAPQEGRKVRFFRTCTCQCADNDQEFKGQPSF